MWQIAVDWARIAPGITPFVALLAVIFAWRQLRNNRVNQCETTAKGIFREYLKLAFEKPEFAEPDYNDLMSDSKTRAKYELFIAYLLWSCEEILRYAKNDAIWRANLQDNVNPHYEYFREHPEFIRNANGSLMYEPEIEVLVSAAIELGAKTTT
jgi:hypothetical protein